MHGNVSGSVRKQFGIIVSAVLFMSVSLILCSKPASAAGFRVSAQGAKAMALGDANVALADDPSALAYNPAGIAFQPGNQVQGGLTAIIVPPFTFDGTTRLSGVTAVHEDSESGLFAAPTLYLTSSLKSLPISFGLGINAFYPLATKWKGNGVFRDDVYSISFKPINFQPTVAYRFDDLKLAVAAGFDITYATVSLNKTAFAMMPPALGGNYTELGALSANGSGVGYGFNLGTQWKPRPDLNFGISYRSRIHIPLKGDADYHATTAIGANPALGLSGNVQTSAAADVTLPDMLTFGVAWKPVDRLMLEFDLERTGWSSYDKLELKFGNGLAAFNNNPDAKNWKDVWAYRFGGQYSLTDSLDLRAGYAFENNPAPDSTLGPELPDADRHNFSIGAGIHNNLGSIDLGYVWVHFADRTVSNGMLNGTFKTDAHLIGASVTYKF